MLYVVMLQIAVVFLMYDELWSVVLAFYGYNVYNGVYLKAWSLAAELLWTE